MVATMPQRSQGSPKCNRDSGEELPKGLGCERRRQRVIRTAPQQLSCQAEYVLVLFLYCQTSCLFGLFESSASFTV